MESRCSEEFHRNFKENYIEEADPRYCEENCTLFGMRCKDCERAFVPRKTKSFNPENEFCPNNTKGLPQAVHYCKYLKGTLHGGAREGTCNVAYCQKCDNRNLDKCGVNPGSPRKQRTTSKPASYKVD